MIAHYGFEDGTGVFYITIDTGRCARCTQKGCKTGCPEGLFELEPDDEDMLVASIKAQARNAVKTACAACKPLEGRPKSLPCQKACGIEAITHSW
ncbi:MAG: hypothetical protein LBS65_09065 [Desulfovibrio sp.]|jgi:hypothetical protein|nr:hypothetical protein [Desulfovibrio sp.]